MFGDFLSYWFCCKGSSDKPVLSLSSANTLWLVYVFGPHNSFSSPFSVFFWVLGNCFLYMLQEDTMPNMSTCHQLVLTRKSTNKFVKLIKGVFCSVFVSFQCTSFVVCFALISLLYFFLFSFFWCFLSSLLLILLSVIVRYF